MNEEVVKQIQDLIIRFNNKDPEAIQQIKDIKQKAEAGDEQAAQMWAAIQQVAQAMQGQQQGQQAPVAAKKGAKLNYIRELKGLCPEGYLLNGGKCKPCEAKMKAKGGDLDPVKSFKANRKNKK